MYISSNRHNFGQLFCSLSAVTCHEVPPNRKTNPCQLNLITYLIRRTQMLAFGTSASPSANSEKMNYPSEVTVTHI
jgi:hypothetical protein